VAVMMRRILGLDLGSHTIKAVELRQTLRGIEVGQLRALTVHEAAADDAHGALETGAVPEREELFGIRADAGASQFRQRPNIEIEDAVGGAAVVEPAP